MSATNTPAPERPVFPGNFCDRMTRSFDNRLPPEIRGIIAESCILPLGLSPTIVDLGCGPGLWLREVANLRRDASVVGYDRDPEMLTHARSLGIPQAEWKQADIGGPTFVLAPASADVIGMHFFFHFFEDPRALLRTVRTALKPGGSLVITGWVRSSLEAFHAFAREMAGGESTQATPGSSASDDELETRMWRMFAQFNRYTPADISWVLTHEGFTVRRDAQYSEHFAYTIARNE